MSSSSNSTEVALQICFGIFSIVGIIVALAGLHHRDSLGCVLFRSRCSQATSHCMEPVHHSPTIADGSSQTTIFPLEPSLHLVHAKWILKVGKVSPCNEPSRYIKGKTTKNSRLQVHRLVYRSRSQYTMRLESDRPLVTRACDRPLYWHMCDGSKLLY